MCLKKGSMAPSFTATTDHCPPGFIALGFESTTDYICADHIAWLSYRPESIAPIVITGVRYVMSFAGSRQQFDELLNLVSKQQSRNRPIAIVGAEKQEEKKEEEEEPELARLNFSGTACAHFMNLWAQQACVSEASRYKPEDLAQMSRITSQTEALAVVRAHKYGALSLPRMINTGKFSRIRYLDIYRIQREIFDYYKNLKGEEVPADLNHVLCDPAAFLEPPNHLAALLREKGFGGIANSIEAGADRYYVYYGLAKLSE